MPLPCLRQAGFGRRRYGSGSSQARLGGMYRAAIPPRFAQVSPLRRQEQKGTICSNFRIVLPSDAVARVLYASRA
jgi:hypothetical protein